MGAEFTPIFLFILVAISVALGMFFASYFLGPKRKTPVKQMPYESGMDPIGDARQRFDVRYYLVAIMFLLFDVELLYLYPWAVAQYSSELSAAPEAGAKVVVDGAGGRHEVPAGQGILVKDDQQVTAFYVPGRSPGIPAEFRWLVFWEILVFIAVLTAAFAYAWRKGVFTWR